jgi:predicted DNA-binding antitoxin AbrB/MazE fold protein
MVVSAKAIYENAALRLLETLNLQESQEVYVTIERLDEDGYPVQETLADVLGFDPEDEEKARKLAESQYQAIQLHRLHKLCRHGAGARPRFRF